MADEFTYSGSYLGISAHTDDQGKVSFDLSDGDYTFRADYLSGQYWSDPFVWLDVEIDIDHSLVGLHVTFNGEDVFDAPVYLFTESGSYLGRYERTDEYGHVQFLIPSRSYKFRVDYEGTQYWSDVVTIIPHEENNIELNLDQLALNLTNDPNPVRYDGKPPVFKGEEIRVASIGSLVGILSQTVIANTSSPKVYYYLNDHLGTPQVITDEGGEVVWEAKYMPFGKADITVNTMENNFRFPGQYFDQETGLHYNYYRYYNPRTGRYLMPDPIGLAGGIYLFLYANANPINFIDPLGLETLYDRIHPSFFNDLKKYNPVEHLLFTQYTKGKNTDLWTDDIRWLELAWKNFNPYARQEATDMIAEGCEEKYKSIYGLESWLGKYLGGLAGLLFGTYSDIGTVGSAASLIEITGKATNIMMNGPAIVN